MNDTGTDMLPHGMKFDDMLTARSEVADVDTLRTRASGIEHWRHVIGRSPTVFTTPRQAAMDDRCVFNATEYMEWARSLDYPDTDRPDKTACAEIADRMYGVCVDREDQDTEFHFPAIWASASMFKQGLSGVAAAYSVILASDRRMEDMFIMIHMNDDRMISKGEHHVINVRMSPLVFTSVLMAILEDGDGLPIEFMIEEILAMGPTVIRPPHANILVAPKMNTWNPMRFLWAMRYSCFLPKETYGAAYYAGVIKTMNDYRTGEWQ